VHIDHTSSTQIGQIYIPGLNWLLAIACVGLVVGFRSSSNLAAAYGVAVTTDMVFTTILFAVVARTKWNWSMPATVALAAGFLVIDLGFWTAGITKIPSGGWFPLVIAAAVFTIMTTWKTGRGILAERLSESAMPLAELRERIVSIAPLRVPGTAVYLTRDPTLVPHSLLLNLHHNKILHERIVFLAMFTETQAYVPAEHRVKIETLAPNVYRVSAYHGFAEDPEVPAVLERCRQAGLDIDSAQSTFFVGRETLLATERPGMAIWRERLYARLARNARRATRFFNIPPSRVVELGAEIEL
jgi:KUP system potassium uptake protein